MLVDPDRQPFRVKVIDFGSTTVRSRSTTTYLQSRYYRCVCVFLAVCMCKCVGVAQCTVAVHGCYVCVYLSQWWYNLL